MDKPQKSKSDLKDWIETDTICRSVLLLLQMGSYYQIETLAASSVCFVKQRHSWALENKDSSSNKGFAVEWGLQQLEKRDLRNFYTMEEASAPSSPESRVSDYSEDSFESITDEPSWTDSRRTGYSGDLFESVSDEFSRNDHSESISVNTSESFSLSDTSQHQSLGRNLIGKWIKIIEDKELETSAHTSEYQPISVTEAVKEQKQSAHSKSPDREVDALQLYCTRKIKNILQQRKTSNRTALQPITYTKHKATGEAKCSVPQHLLNKLRLENFKETMKQVAEIKMHCPSTCQDCCNKKSELAKSKFIKMNKTKLETNLLNEKMETLMYSKDLVTCIGEIHQSLPRLSEERSSIWHRLCNSGIRT
ncbi:uncharacterized protein C8orf48 homolog [Bombina bombina]|uniref:uncharacterized protein C8orf48 homolog n=1 Tax=Bombina bombina TaxID=8345 RepID=UPI00235B1A62|nr:uncharacterized protein C8orf48 homolog [Bombina bombina]